MIKIQTRSGMKMIFFFLLLFITFTQCVSAQTFRGTPVELRDHQLSASIKNYKVFSLDVHDIAEYVQNQSRSTIPCTFIMGSQVFEWTLYENQMLRDDVKATTMRNGTYQPILFDKKCRTFIGVNEELTEKARFTITSRNFVAMIPHTPSNIFIQPVHHFIPSADKNLVVMYEAKDYIENSPGYCGNKSIIPTQPEEGRPLEETVNRNNSRTYNCLELEVAFATDYFMYEDFSFSADELLDYNMTVMNIMEPMYDDFDLDFWVEEFFITTDYPNLWGDENHAHDLLDDFSNWADAYFGPQDVGHLWSGQDLVNDDGNGVAGVAWVGGACGDIGITPWAILEGSDENNFAQKALLQAHEYGHLLDADHEEGSGTIMEPSLGDVECTCWDPDNIYEMNDFIEDEACIATCVQCPFSYDILDYIGWGDWKYSSLNHITSTGIIDGEADVIFQSVGYVKLKPGFKATSRNPSSGGATLIAKIAPCE